MTNIYEINPFDDAKELKAPWLKELKSYVKDTIELMKSEIKKEAEYDGQTELTDEKFLYKRFKDNCQTGMIYGNWEVFKYFLRNMRLKLCYEMIGELKYTKEDKEMYDYFMNIEVTEKTKCKHSIIKFKSSAEQSYQNVQFHCSQHEEYAVYYNFKSETGCDYYENQVVAVPYFTRFSKLFNSLSNMVAHVKMLKVIDNTHFFNVKERYRSPFTEYVKAEYISHSVDEIELKVHKDELDTFKKGEILKSFNTFCEKNDEYQKLMCNFKLLQKHLFYEFKKTDTFRKSDNLAQCYIQSMFV